MANSLPADFEMSAIRAAQQKETATYSFVTVSAMFGWV
jgi:hypothetical protein